MSTKARVGTVEHATPITELRPVHLPDVPLEEIRLQNLEVIAIGGISYVYQYNGLAYKLHCFQREFEMMQKAGDCSVRAVARVVSVETGQPVMTGLLMELGKPFNVKAVEESDKATIRDEMIRLVGRLHKGYRMVHGDIKPANLVRCSDGKLRLCDFDSARPIDEDPQAWEGIATEQYLAPNRDYFDKGTPPTPSDDVYALGVSLWELYTGKSAYDELGDIEEALKQRRTVDILEVKDSEVRNLIKGFLKQGGALL